jgi:hypothetical protein
MIPEVNYGAGKHIDQIPPPDVSKALKLNLVVQALYIVGISVAKMSIGFFLLRFAITPVYRRTIISIIGQSSRTYCTVRLCHVLTFLKCS